MSFGDNLQTLRKERNLSQERLADDLNVSRQCISKWELESAYPETEKLILLSEYFNVSIDTLVKGTVEMHTAEPNPEPAHKSKPSSAMYRNIRFVVAICLLLLSPFWPVFSRGTEVARIGAPVFMLFLSMIAGFGLLLYNHLSNPKKSNAKAE